MKFYYNKNYYDVVIEKKRTTKNTYIRVNKDLEIKVTCNTLTPKFIIQNLIDDNYKNICKMIDVRLKKIENNDGFFLLGKKYNIVYDDNIKDIKIDDDVVYINRSYDINKYYRKVANDLFNERFELQYRNFSRKIPTPSLRIRKMTSKWGVCNIKTHVITLNLELIKRDVKYLDYVIIHELSHLIYGNHNKYFWSLVEDNMKDYKKYKEEMKEF